MKTKSVSPTASLRNLIVLVIAQVLTVTAVSVVVFVGGISGGELTSNPELATLPIALMVVGVALFSIPASFFMKRFGRKTGFLSAALIGCLASLMAAAAIAWGSFALFCLALLLIGAHSSFAQQYRFAATESVPPHLESRAVSMVLLGGVLGGFFGPALVTLTHAWAGLPEYSFTFIALALLFLGIAVSMAFLARLQVSQGPTTIGGERPMRLILNQRGFLVAVLGGAVAYSVMSLLMTATPISMHTMHGFSLDSTGWVIRSHVIAMFLPSLISGWLISRLGVAQVMGIGTFAMALTAILDIAGIHFLNYWTALVLLGIGWNFLFIGSTVLLTRYYAPPERFKAQAFNDFIIFGVQALATLSAGSLIYMTSWSFMNLLVLPVLLLMLVAIVFVARRSVASALPSSS